MEGFRNSKISGVATSVLIAVVLAAVALGFGCLDQRPEIKPSTSENKLSTYRKFTDDLGREVSLPDKVERAVSLAPSLTEMAFAAGAGDRLVGVTTYCNFPAETAAISKVGDTQSPNVERIVALQPQIVLVSTASQLESFMSVLAEQNIAVYVLDVRGIDDVPRGLRTLGTIFGSDEIAGKSASQFEWRVSDSSHAAIPTPRPNVFLQISKEPLFTIGKDSFLTELIQRAGGVSVTKDVASGYPKLSKETALAMNPDVIILSDSEDNREPNEVFKNSPAVKNGRVYRINADVISRPGPRLVDALEEIARHLKVKSEK
jgi:ABC-type Fe3+-hydroxamate transport system substrate-binding protein